jgi:hypothetical protein
MSKHKKKKNKDKEEVLTMTQDYAIINAANSLLYAEELARINADTEMLLAISDRWLNVSKILEPEDGFSKNKSFGFVGTIEESELYGEVSAEGSNTSKGRSKVRKKSR